MNRSGVAAMLVIAACVVSVSPAAADGPFEPNESASEAYGPLTGGTITAALETPQDVDWYRFYALPQRQVGVLATLPAPCPQSYGSIRLEVIDGDGSSLPLGSINLGHDYTGNQTSADHVLFTSERGHRYFVKVIESACSGANYTLGLAPAEDLTSTLQDTVECAAAKRDETRAENRVISLQRLVKQAHGRRRRDLRGRLALQRQSLVVAKGTISTACTRPALIGYPWQ